MNVHVRAFLPPLLCWFLVGFGSTASAGIVAGFDGGNASDQVDAYAGMPGLGWATAWQSGTGGASFSGGPAVESASPLGAGLGNYLAATLLTSGANGQGAVARQYGDPATGDVDVSQPHTIRFLYRPDDLAGFSDGNDRFMAYTRPSVREGTDASADWMILGQGGDFQGAPVAGKWIVFDGQKDGGGFSGSQFVNTGIGIRDDAVYEMLVTVHPSAQEYDVRISDGTNTYVGANLGFRRDAPPDSPGTFLHFGGRANASGEARSFSVDGIEIRQIHPPFIVAHFDRGNGTTYVDQFTGAAGRGWTAGWSTDGGLSATVATANPLAGPGDPYLEVVSTGIGDTNVVREFEQYGGVDPAQPHRIQWQWRFDGDLADMTVFDDRIHFFGSDSGATGTSTASSWIVGYTSADRGGNDVHDGNWYFYDGADGNGFAKENMVNTGMTLTPGAIYEFDVWVYPQLGLYNASMFDGTDSFSAYGLTFRNGLTGEFNILRFGGKGNAAGDLAFSLDSLVISQVPEPATWGMGLSAAVLGAALLGRMGGRRSRRRA